MPRQLWFTADTHFGHTNMIERCGRPYPNVEAMNNSLIHIINEVVDEQDILWHLGDFLWTGNVPMFRDKIRCKEIHLVKGNHDERLSAWELKSFASVQEYKALRWEGVKYILCHYPIQSWRRNWIHLHGHSHGKCNQRNWRIDVGVDPQQYRPISAPEVDAIVAMQPSPWSIDIRELERGS